MAKNILRILGFFAVGMIGGIFADQIFHLYLLPSSQPVYLTEKKEIYIQENVVLVNSIEKVEKMVIGVKSKTLDGEIKGGAGMIVTSDGLAVTLSELIPQGSTFYFYVDSLPVSYQVLKRDATSDLALLKLEKNNLPAAGFADMDKVRLGTRIFLLGKFFATSTPENIVDEGIIKKIEKNYLKTNIANSEGAEGSVLFDIEGNAVGLNKIDAKGNLITIPISTIKQFVGF
jgi:S1-C subfamily serine protease